jgi:hypothetical protein
MTRPTFDRTFAILSTVFSHQEGRRMKDVLRWSNSHRWKSRIVLGVIVAAAALGLVLLLTFAQRRTSDGSKQVRQRRVSEEPLTSGTSQTVRVPPAGDLQRILNSAKCGDTIILEAGAFYKPSGDSFVLPQKRGCTGTDADYITIQTSNLAGISGSGQRIDPARHAAAMPRLVGSSGNFVIIAAAGAHHYKFIGIEITTNGNPDIYTPDLVNLGAYFTREQRLDTNHFVFDRMFLHAPEITPANLFPTSVERTVGRGMALGISEVWVTNSYLAGFSGKYPKSSSAAGQNIDSYGIYSDGGPGPIRIINNYIEAQFNNIFIGGAGMPSTNTATVSDTTSTSGTFSNVENLAVGDLVAFAYARCTPALSSNVYAKPWETGRVTAINGKSVSFTIVKAQNSCAAGPPDNGGIARWNGDHIHDVEIRRNTLNKPDVWNAFSNPKAWIEVKEAQNLIVDGNDMYSGVGTAIALTVRNQDGASPWSTIENVTITNNKIRGYKWGFSLMMTDNEQPSMMGNNIAIKNNLFSEPRGADQSAVNFLQLVGGHNITVQHNTLIQPGSPVVSDLATPNFVFKDNIVANYQYGMQCTVQPNSLSSCWPGLVMSGNVIIDTRWDKGDGSLSNRYPVGNYYVNSPNDIGFVDMVKGNYELAPNSKFRGRASDSKDPGCDITALKAALPQLNQ